MERHRRVGFPLAATRRAYDQVTIAPPIVHVPASPSPGLAILS